MQNTKFHESVAIFTVNTGNFGARLVFPDSPLANVPLPVDMLKHTIVNHVDGDDIDYVLRGGGDKRYQLEIIAARQGRDDDLGKRITSSERKPGNREAQLAGELCELIQSTLELEFPPYNVVVFLS